MKRYLCGREQTVRVRIAEIAQPIVESPADRCSEFGVDIIRADGVSRVGSKNHAEVDSLFVHRLKHVQRRTVVFAFTAAEFLVPFFSSSATDGDIFLAVWGVGPNRNRTGADLPYPFPASAGLGPALTNRAQDNEARDLW